jgi:hypothetical protein
MKKCRVGIWLILRPHAFGIVSKKQNANVVLRPAVQALQSMIIIHQFAGEGFQLSSASFLCQFI